MVKAPAAKPPRAAPPARRKRLPAPAAAAAGPAAPLRPLGRSLADFGKLSPTEEELLEACRIGGTSIRSVDRPEEETDDNSVRALFIRFLALGGDETAPVDAEGVQLMGAWLTGTLDVMAAKVERPLLLYLCRIERIKALDATLKSLNLSGSRLENGLAGDRLRCEGTLFLQQGFHATGEVRLLGATISGNLTCAEGRFENGENHCLSCDGATISGDALLNEGFHATGGVRLPGATIGGDLRCSGGVFEKGRDCALSCDRAVISGNFLLGHGFHATGPVSFLGAKVGGFLGCDFGRFQNGKGSALSCERAEVVGAMFFRDVTIEGGITLSAMHVGTLCDDAASWTGANGRLRLDGFTYGRLAGSAPTDSRTRTAWLDLQEPDEIGRNFKPQPWEQLIKVLREMGHPDEARSIAVEKQKRLRKAGRLPRGARPFHWLYGALVGYGYRPMRLLGVTGAVWFLCALAYWWAANPGSFGPATHLVAPPPRAGDVPRPDYANFVPLIYSADVLLPVVDLGYKDEWQPVVSQDGKPVRAGQILRFLYWFEIAFGWVAGLLLVGVLGSLIKKD